MNKLIAILLFGFCLTATAAQEISVISDRSDFHLRTLATNFEKETGITVKLTFVNKGIIERSRSGNFDLMISKDSSEVIASKGLKLLKPLPPRVLDAVPDGFKDSENKQWLLMSYRIRAFHVAKTTKDVPLTYEDLAKPQYRGRICIRPLTDNYNLEMFGTLLSDMGDVQFEKWFAGFKSNLARNPIGNDRAQVEGVFNKVCDIAIANTYYRGIMLDDPDQRKWAEATTMYIPNQNNGTNGAVALYAGIGMLSNNVANEKFIFYLLRDDIQRDISIRNYEYPINQKNTSEASQKYGVEQGLDYRTIRVHPDIQNNLFELRKRAYLIIKSM